VSRRVLGNLAQTLGACVQGLQEILHFVRIEFYPPAYCIYTDGDAVPLQDLSSTVLANQQNERLLGDMLLHHRDLLYRTCQFHHRYPNTPQSPVDYSLHGVSAHPIGRATLSAKGNTAS
jgi:hypothetical protein